MVHPIRRFRGMEREGISLVGPWKAYVFSLFGIQFMLIAPNLLICSGLWQEYTLVRVNPHHTSLSYS
jgi:hypothetical protein